MDFLSKKVKQEFGERARDNWVAISSLLVLLKCAHFVYRH